MNEKWEANVKRVMRIVDSFPKPRAKKVKEMLDSPVGEQFFLAPASTRKNFHNAFPGGLLEHSLTVTDNVLKIADGLGAFQDRRDSLQFAALFHDLGKAGDGEHPHYVPVKDDWKRNKGELYEVNPECPFMTTGERGVVLLWKFDLQPTYDEMMALRLNDGMGARENAPYAFKEPPFALLVHWADHWATMQEKGRV